MGQKRGKLIVWVGGGEGRRVDFQVGGEAGLEIVRSLTQQGCNLHKITQSKAE